jgi:hypothetical protein
MAPILEVKGAGHVHPVGSPDPVLGAGQAAAEHAPVKKGEVALAAIVPW